MIFPIKKGRREANLLDLNLILIRFNISTIQPSKFSIQEVQKYFSSNTN